MLKRQTPFTVLIIAALVGLAAFGVVLFLALNQPWLGLKLAVDDKSGNIIIDQVAADGPARLLTVGVPLASIGGIALEAGDLVEEPDVAENYVALERFFDRQTALGSLLRGDELNLDTVGGGQTVISPLKSRPFFSLPVVFWVQIASGLLTLLIGAWVWSLRRTELSAALLACAGAGTFLAAFPAAVYSSREIALPGDLFHVLSAINHFGALTFGVAMVALFLIYPRQLVPARVLWILPICFGAVWLLDTTWTIIPGPPEGHHLPTVILMIGIVLGATLQFRVTKGDPAARAAIRWFALSVCICAGTFVTVVLMPNLFGMTPYISQGYAFVLFGMLFIGVAIGVARYRLFELEGWAFSILFYFGAVTVLVLFDAALISFVVLDRPAAFALSLLFVAIVYLPLRDWLARRLMPKQEIDREELFGRIVDVALTKDSSRDARWRQVLQDAFHPLHVAHAPSASLQEPAIVDDGVSLLVPGISGVTPVKLSYANAGRRLFSPLDRRFAKGIYAMLAHAIASREAHEKGAAEERIRIARDMHDNMGAQLLSALHSNTPERKDTLIRETITDLRDIVNNAARGGKSLDEVLVDLKVEALERLAAANIELDWRDACEDGQITLAPNIAHSLRSIIREIVSNTIRHSGAQTMSVQLEARDGAIHLILGDDGRGFPVNGSQAGNGLSNIEARILALKGRLHIDSTEKGLLVRAEIPMHEDRAG